MRLKSFVLVSFLVLSALSYQALAQNATSPGDCVLIKQKCKLRLKQSKFGFELGGVDFTAGPVQKVGQIKIGNDLMQQMTPIAQILDQMQLSRCELLNRLRTCDAVREKIIIVQAASEMQLYQLALIAQLYSASPDKLTEAMLKWIVQSSDTIQKIYAKQFMAADDQTAANLKNTNEALKFAIGRLNVSPGTPEFQSILESDRVSSLLSR